MARANNEPHEEYVEDVEANPAPGTIGGGIESVEPGVDPSGTDDDSAQKTTAERDIDHRQGTKVATGGTDTSDGLATDKTDPADVDPHRWDGPGLANPGDDRR
jgi:hypothetical protein